MSGVPRCMATRGPASAGLIGLGSAALVIGVLVYLTDREPSHALLLPSLPALQGSALFGPAGAWLPSLLHVFAFSLFTAAACGPAGAPAYRACALWWSLDTALEIGQAPGLDVALADGLVRLGGTNMVTAATGAYLRQGTFDFCDVVAITAGALAAAAVLRWINRRDTKNAN